MFINQPIHTLYLIYLPFIYCFNYQFKVEYKLIGCTASPEPIVDILIAMPGDVPTRGAHH
jgi:hypothetical protein